MIGENRLGASDPEIVDRVRAYLTHPMTELFQRLVDYAAANVIYARAQQQFYADQHRQPAEFAVGDRFLPCLPSPNGQAQAHGDATAVRLGTSRSGFEGSTFTL
ncbi:hypothetical protein Efla_003467 [Eimeria flavescens]